MHLVANCGLVGAIKLQVVCHAGLSFRYVVSSFRRSQVGRIIIFVAWIYGIVSWVYRLYAVYFDVTCFVDCHVFVPYLCLRTVLVEYLVVDRVDEANVGGYVLVEVSMTGDYCAMFSKTRVVFYVVIVRIRAMASFIRAYSGRAA